MIDGNMPYDDDDARAGDDRARKPYTRVIDYTPPPYLRAADRRPGNTIR